MSQRSPLVTLAALTVAFGAVLGANAVTSDARTASPSNQPEASAYPASPATLVTPPPARPEVAPSTAAPDKAGPRPPEERVYLGRTADGTAAVAVAVLGDRAVGYLCDGRSVEAWLRGRVDGDELVLRGRDGAWLRASVDGARLVGQVRAAGDRDRFALRRAGKPAGLYRARGSETTIGWIVLPDGSQVGLRTGPEGSDPAPELNPTSPAVTLDGSSATAQPVDADDPV